MDKVNLVRTGGQDRIEFSIFHWDRAALSQYYILKQLMITVSSKATDGSRMIQEHLSLFEKIRKMEAHLLPESASQSAPGQVLVRVRHYKNPVEMEISPHLSLGSKPSWDPQILPPALHSTRSTMDQQELSGRPIPSCLQKLVKPVTAASWKFLSTMKIITKLHHQHLKAKLLNSMRVFCPGRRVTTQSRRSRRSTSVSATWRRWGRSCLS